MKLNWAVKLLFCNVPLGIALWHSSKMQFAGGTFWFGSSCLKLAIFTRAKIILFHSHHQTTVTILLIIKASSSLCFSSPFNMVIIIKQRGKAPLASVGDGSGHMTLPCCRFLTDCQQIFNQPKKIFNQPKLIFNQLPDASQLMLVYAKSSQSIPLNSLCQDCTLSVSSDEFYFESNLRCDPY